MKPSKTVTTFVAASVCLAGCVAPGGTTVPQMTNVNYYPQCYQSVALLRQQDQQFQQAMAVNTLGGAAGGAALGALASGGDWRGALIGAGGYGEPILTGIRLDDIGLILRGAVPAAALALLVMGAFQLLERALTPRGLREFREP